MCKLTHGRFSNLKSYLTNDAIHRGGIIEVDDIIRSREEIRAKILSHVTRGNISVKDAFETPISPKNLIALLKNN